MTSCRSTQLWDFIGLVSSFLDLFIALLLLCASFIAYIVSKFLSLFGLSLPCPCDGLFGNRNGNYCKVQKVLVDSPMEKISSVHFLVRTRFPFDSRCYFTRRRVRIHRVRKCLRTRKFVGSDHLSDFDGCRVYAPVEDIIEDPLDPGSGEPCKRSKSIGENASTAANELKRNTKVRVAEDEPEEESVALQLELEKERSAAASAADEAMAMILRLQEEKASIEMEARQFKRMMEEKSAYDAEEMNILKEILLRREREKHFLEKGNEAYRAMIFGTEQLDTDMHDLEASEWQMGFSSLADEDPYIMKQEDVPSYPVLLRSNNNEELSEIEEPKRDVCQQVKQLLNTDVSVLLETSVLCEGLESKTPERSTETKINVSGEVDKFEETLQLQDSGCLEHGRDLFVHELDMLAKVDMQTVELSNSSPAAPIICDSPTIDYKSLLGDSDMSRSCSDITSGFPKCISRGRGGLSKLRRNSMSTVDYERYKIDNEVQILRERLKVVQEGRERLSFSAGDEKIKLQLHKDVSSPEVVSNARDWRSVSLVMQRSC